MSLINDMLRDLDGYTGTVDAQSLETGIAPEKKTNSSTKRLWLPALAILAVLYAVFIEWNGTGMFSDTKDTPTNIPEPVALNSKWLNPSPETAVSLAPSETISNTDGEVTINQSPVGPDTTFAGDTLVGNTASSATGNPHVTELSAAESYIHQESNTLAGKATEEKTENFIEGKNRIAANDPIERLLAAADSALAENRLTSPAGNNAYQYFKSVLLLDQENAAALHGISSLQERYLDWLEHALMEQRFPAAHRYLNRARIVGVSEHKLTIYAKQLTAAESAPANSQAFAATAINTEARIAESENPAKKIESGNAIAIENPVSDANASPIHTMITPVVNSDAEMAADLRARGWRAERAIRSWLVDAPEIEQTAVALADFYAAQGRISQLNDLHNALVQRAHPTSVYAAAQAAVVNGSESDAIGRLALVEFSGAEEERRLRLLAGMQQKIGDFNSAMELYSRLVGIAPGNVTDWLGLAVSADNGRHENLALNAYEKVVQLQHPDARVMQFARQRLQDLLLAAQLP